MRKSDLGWIVFAITLGGILFFAIAVDRLPKAYHRYLKDMQHLRAQHEQIIEDLQQSSEPNRRLHLSRRYVLESQIWQAGVSDFIAYMENLGNEVFLTTRNKTIISGKIRELKGFAELIAETRVMLKNAMNGKISAKHRALGLWQPKEGQRMIESLRRSAQSTAP